MNKANYFDTKAAILDFDCPILNRFKPSSKILLLTVLRRYIFCGSFVLFMSCVCHAFASVHCFLVVICWERADLLALCVRCLIFFHFPLWYPELGGVLYCSDS